MSNPALAMVFVSLAIASVPRSLQDKKFEHNKQAELDAQGNVYVSSDKSNLIKMADSGHCLEIEVADDKQTVGCVVRLNSEEPPQSLQLEIYLRGGQRKMIGPGAPIRDWHFWRGGQQVIVYSGPHDSSGPYALYDTASAHLIEKLAEPSNERQLPQWAKGRRKSKMSPFP
jgi:hypothetical protein